jgi:glyoxylase-like metal-dependent hydrolase (beta-lactamase superfamily II)
MSRALKIGEMELHWLQGGVFELDGGTMFGVVPRVLWAKKFPPDKDNYIRMLNAPILVKSPHGLAVIETGLGNKLTEKQRKIFRIREDWDIPGSLSSLGIGRDDITHVVLTHCDFDHAGGVVMRNDRGEHELTFPRAQHIVQRTEWEDAMSPNQRASHTYWPQNFEELKASDNLRLVGGEYEVFPGVFLVPTGGHTRGHQIVRITSDEDTAVHMADLLPTHIHFNPLWIMAYDNFPLDAIAQKEAIEKQGVQEGAWFTFYHDPFMKACRFEEDGTVKESFQSPSE